MRRPREGRMSAPSRLARATLALLAIAMVAAGSAGATAPQLGLAVSVSPYTSIPAS